MAGKPTVGGKVAVEYCKKYAGTSSLMLARMLKEDNPALYHSVEHARSLVRSIRGANGDRARAYRGKAGTLVPKVALPEPEPERFKVVELPKGIKRWLILADLHIPYHELEPLEVALEYAGAENTRCDGILILGDLMDLHELSPFVHDPRRRDFGAELEDTAKFLEYASDKVKPKRILWKKSNHEARLERYLSIHAPELFKAAEDNRFADFLDFEGFLSLREQNVTLLPREHVLSHRHLTLVHGDEWGSSYVPVNPARTTFLKTFSCVISAHCHRTSMNPEVQLFGGTVITCWSIGCMCTLHPDWKTLTNWNHGFAILDLTGKTWKVENYRIVKGEIL